MGLRDSLCVASPEKNWGFGRWILEFYKLLEGNVWNMAGTRREQSQSPSSEQWILPSDKVKVTRMGLDTMYMRGIARRANSGDDPNVIWFTDSEFADIAQNPEQILQYYLMSSIPLRNAHRSIRAIVNNIENWNLDFGDDKTAEEMREKYADDYAYARNMSRPTWAGDHATDHNGSKYYVDNQHYYDTFKKHGKDWNLAYRAWIYGRDVEDLKGPDDERMFSIKPHARSTTD